MHATFGESIQPERPLAHHKSAKVLIVEDEKLVAWDMREILREAGLRSVAMAHSLRDAKRIIAKHNLALVFLDLKLPDGDGGGLLAELDRRQVATVIVTGYPRSEAGERPALLKPYSTKDLLAITARMLDGARSKSAGENKDKDDDQDEAKTA
jgi:DNA-binding NtrC family response regulator